MLRWPEGVKPGKMLHLYHKKRETRKVNGQQTPSQG